MKIIFRFRRRKKSLFSSRLKQREIVENNVQLSNKELFTLNWKLFGPYFVDNILQFYHETYISYILDDFRQYCPRIEDNIVYFCARQYCPLSKWTYFLGSTTLSTATEAGLPTKCKARPSLSIAARLRLTWKLRQLEQPKHSSRHSLLLPHCQSTCTNIYICLMVN